MISTPFSIFMSGLTIYTIFAIDIDKGFFNQNASIFFSSIHVVSMVIFILQIIFMAKTQKDYVLQFYFWIDIFSTLTMILQLIWIQDLMNSIENIQVAISVARVSKASRFSKIGARSTKIMKLIRLIKLMKFMRKQQPKQEQIQQQEHQQQLRLPQTNHILNSKSVKSFNGNVAINEKQKQCVSFGTQNNTQQLRQEQKNIILNRKNVDANQQYQIQQKWEAQSIEIANKNNPPPVQQSDKGTKVGEILKYLIQKNIVIMVMALIIIVPMLSADTWYNKTIDMQFTTQYYLDAIQNQYNGSAYATEWLNILIDLSLRASNPIVSFQYEQFCFPCSTNSQTLPYDIVSVDQLRLSQKIVLTDENRSYNLIYSKKSQTKITSWINMCRSVFITLVLLLASIFFVKDLQNYALSPLQKMNNTVEKIQKNPFSSMQPIDEIEEEQDELLQQNKQNEQLQLQTNVLEKLLIKITSLLALGVGETLSKQSNSQISLEGSQNQFFQETTVNIQGVFMVMQIANMEQITQILQNQSAIYFNSIIQAFHQTVIQNGGFIYNQDQCYSTVCWKTDSSAQRLSQKNMQHKIQQKKNIEMALHTYIKFCHKISLIKYLNDNSILKSNLREFPNCKVHIGIHTGNSFCGAIGSQFKLSFRAMGRAVSVAKTLCRIAKKIRTGICFSSTIYKQAYYIHNISRKIDEISFVQLNKFNECVDIYTAYFQYEHTWPLGNNQKTKDNSELTQFKLRKKMNRLLKKREQILANGAKHKPEQFILISKNLFKKYPNVQQWLQTYKDSQNFYQQGQWDQAKAGFNNIKEFYPQFSDFIADIHQKQMSNKDVPPLKWKKRKQFSLFL